MSAAVRPQPQTHHIDVRGLEPPEPLERVLEALDRLPEGDHLCMLIEREPRPLYRILAQNGYGHATSALPDYLYEVRIWRRVPAA
ncbi:DUF2249 domain-containing protein [Massilia atriviolacea]|uniref:DUF2249 domain-containing protein n=1 Tax=Massilia atriviolacea TaxID=2495579 RepID=A0A430HT53_9BURK|nr:DUF2249 domain-containing protein [Massilia atriviolacea]RSZ60682.1 DUF2249 domain-containing protein [Massilia atriviolacea]